jgi:hypothetical protein
MPGLAPISEASSETTRSELSNASQNSRLEAIRRLRFGSRVNIQTKARGKNTEETPLAKSEPKSQCSISDREIKAGHVTEILDASEPVVT